MTPSQTDRYNASYFGIPVEWMPLHNLFMSAYFNKSNYGIWPQELKDFCDAQYRRTGFCGDVMACAIGDWMKMKGEITVRQLMEKLCK